MTDPSEFPVSIEGVSPGDTLHLPTAKGAAEQAHVISQAEILAVRTAIAARRALLVRGEPGTGKTQLARAAAQALRRPFVPFTVDARTEARDLLWRFDAVARLADAQARGAMAPRDKPTATTPHLAITRYIQPGPLWWAFDWKGAEAQAAMSGAPRHTPAPGCDARNGAVVLIDEIDKAESEVPNGLLEALGAGAFTPQGFAEPIGPGTAPPPLVIITTNEERTLPDAFIRRCLVLHLLLPKDRQALIAHLVASGRAHFGLDRDELLTRAAELLADDRQRARDNNWRPYPGQAEYLDLVRAVIELGEKDGVPPMAWLERVSGFALHKHLDAGLAGHAAP
jgi:MoxR-like ATPase